MIICIHRNVGIWYSVLEKKFHIRSQNACGHPLFTTTQSLDTEPVLTVFSLPQKYDLISCGGRGGRGSVTHIPRRWERLFPDDDVPHNPHLPYYSKWNSTLVVCNGALTVCNTVLTVRWLHVCVDCVCDFVDCTCDAVLSVPENRIETLCLKRTCSCQPLEAEVEILCFKHILRKPARKHILLP